MMKGYRDGPRMVLKQRSIPIPTWKVGNTYEKRRKHLVVIGGLNWHQGSELLLLNSNKGQKNSLIMSMRTVLALHNSDMWVSTTKAFKQNQSLTVQVYISISMVYKLTAAPDKKVTASSSVHKSLCKQRCSCGPMTHHITRSVTAQCILPICSFLQRQQAIHPSVSLGDWF
jgi:hypothetical protein